MSTAATNATSGQMVVGGLAGDPAEAFNPAATGDCCGSAPAATSTATMAAPLAPAASTCCGTAEAAQAAGACCDPAAKNEAVATGAGCCG